MKLYYSPGACSLSPNIVLREAGVAFDLERVDTSTKKTETNADFLQVNPKGYVPVLRLGPIVALPQKLEPLSVPACRSIPISQHLSCTRPSARCSHPTRAKRASRLPSPMSSASSNILSVFSRMDVPISWATNSPSPTPICLSSRPGLSRPESASTNGHILRSSPSALPRGRKYVRP